MDNDSLLSVFLIIAIITVIAIDSIIIYIFIKSFCCKSQDNSVNDLRKPLIGVSINETDNIDNYYTSL